MQQFDYLHRPARLIQLGIRQARFSGRKKTLVQLLMAATVANLTPVVNKTGQMASRRGQASPFQVGQEASSRTRYRLSVSSGDPCCTSPPGKAGFSAGLLDRQEDRSHEFSEQIPGS